MSKCQEKCQDIFKNVITIVVITDQKRYAKHRN